MIDALTNVHFLRPLWLLAPAPALLLWWLAGRVRRDLPGWEKAVAPHLLRHLVTGADDPTRLRGPLGLFVLFCVLAAVGVAGPTWQLADDPEGPDGSPVLLALELSSTMDGRDVGPTRAKRGRLSLLDLLKARGSGRTALFSWAGSAHTVMPLTDDPSAIEPYLAALEPSLMPTDGDDLGALVPLLARTLDGLDEPATVVLVTDGVSPDGAEAFAAFARERGVSVVLWAMGTSHGDPTTGAPALDRSSLDRLARSTGGHVVDLALGGGDVSKVLRVVRSTALAQADPSDAGLWIDAGWWLAWPLVIVCLMWFRRGWVVRVVPAALVMISLSLAGCDRPLDPWLTRDQQGQRLFNGAQYTDAAQVFDDRYRRAISLYAAGDWQGTMAALDGARSVRSQFLLGNAWAQQGGIVSAIAAYEQVLRDEPTHLAARANRDLLQGVLDGLVQSTDKEDALKPIDPVDQATVQLGDEQTESGGASPGSQPVDDGPLSPQVEARWMERVATRPEDFLRRKFAAQQQAAP